MATRTYTLSLPRSQSDSLAHAYAVICVALIAATFAAIFMRLAHSAGIPSVMVAAGRLLFAHLILTPLVLRRYRTQLRRLSHLELLLITGAGLWIAVHFVFLAYSLEHLTVLVVTVVINTTPLWVALLERFFLKAQLPRLVWIGLIVALAGSAIISLGGDTSGTTAPGDPTLGAVLAMLGAMAGSVYITIGRKVRAKVSLIPYVWMVFGVGALFGLGAMGITHTPLTGYSPEGYFWLLLLALGPQLIGHSGFNYALKYLSATLVSLSSLLLAVSTAVVAYWLFGEVPGGMDIIGSVIVGAGVALAIVGQRKKRG